MDGVTVRRFPVEEERDLAAFNRFSESLYDQPHTDEDERDWLRRQGPYVPAPGRGAARASRTASAAVLFFTYLYYPTCRGPAGRAGAVDPRADHARRAAAALPPLPRGVRAAAGVRVPDAGRGGARPRRASTSGRVPAFGRRHGRGRAGGARRGGLPGRDTAWTEPYLLYAGRIDAGKGCAEMLAHYERYRGRAERPARPAPDRAAGHGRAARARACATSGSSSEEDKQAAFAGASAVICPSPYESLSIVLLEGFARGVPGAGQRAVGRAQGPLRAVAGRASATRTATSSSKRSTTLMRGRRAASRPGRGRPRHVRAPLPLGRRAGPLPIAHGRGRPTVGGSHRLSVRDVL